MKAGSAADSGFAGPSSNTAFTLDLNAGNPIWQPTSPMQYPRSFINLTNLPNGSVAVGGGTEKSSFDDSKAVKAAEIWDPATGLWRTVAAMASAAVPFDVTAAPGWRVFVSGGGGDSGVTDQKNYQIYSPHTCSGSPASHNSVPGTVQYNSNVLVETPDSGSIQSVSLIRTGAVTHAFDQNERALSLPFTQAPGGLSVPMPANGNYAPPGHYMLSLVNSNGVPSVASMVRFPAPFEDTMAPTAPAGLSAAGSTGLVDLAWEPSSDNIGVAKYIIYRSGTAGFIPGPASQVAQVAGTATSYRDSGLAAGTYFYQVKAEDAASNQSPPSNEASGQASGDTTPPTAPAGLTATAGTGQISLAWTASSDNVGVARYNISRNGSALTNVTGTSYAEYQ